MHPDEKEITRLSKFLSLVLRHQPEKIGLTLDNQGWTDVNSLMEKAEQAGVHLHLTLLQHIVATNAKKRFSFDETGTRIRANQGHSVAVELGYLPAVPPAILYHGTALAFLEPILNHGLQKQKRHHVHLSPEFNTARQVGQRHGKPVVLTVQATTMHQQGYSFFRAANGVWLTDQVPAKYLQVLNESE